VFYLQRAAEAGAPGLAFTNAEVDLHIHPRAPEWEAVEAALGVPVFLVSQVHGNRVLEVTASSDPAQVIDESADALITTARGIGLAVRVADCVPVLLWNDAAIVAAHAGRVGLERGVLQASVAALRRFGDTPQAWVGPHICGACYEVPEAMRDGFCAGFPTAGSTTSWGTCSLDLGAAVRGTLDGLGVSAEFDDPCTMTTPAFHSYRRDGSQSGRQAAVIWR
jgi:YfiH family protein